MAEKKLFLTIPNLVAAQVTEKAPWEFKPQVPDEARVTKGQYREWLAKPTTPHCMYSYAEGAIKGMRISEDNPIIKVHGLIADYDTVISDEVFNLSMKESPGEFRPNWSHSTPSGGRRLIWTFQTPALVYGMEMARMFLDVAAKNLKAKNYLAGLCFDSLGNPATYYDVGTRWQEMDSAPVPENFVFSWLFDMGAMVTRKDFDGPAIPLEVVAKEVETRFPGRWQGEFIKGASGPRFWDATSDNPRACVVNRFGTGMQCFTGGTAFMPWVAIFGPDFTNRYKAETLGSVMAGTWYDGRSYWRKTAEGWWFPWSKEAYLLYLRTDQQLGTHKAKGRSSSEVDDVLQAVHNQKVVMGAAPSVYFPDGPIMIDGERHLNISTLKTMEPADGDGSVWGKDFPWLANFLDAFFPDPVPRTIFLGWLQRAYAPAYRQLPLTGQVTLLAGGTGRGKSLLSTVIVSKMLGGSMDASRYFLGEDKFTDYVVSKPLWTVDDEVPATSANKQLRYSAMLKKVVANCEHIYEKKFMATGKVIWLGRVIITCNLDPNSIRLLPNMDQSNAEKINLFRCSDVDPFPVEFPDRRTLIKIIDQELPYLCRWLLTWELPKQYRGASRMGVIHYHDPLLYNSSVQSSDSFSFMEILQLFLLAYRELYPKAEIWKGTATDLLSQLGMQEALKPLVSRMSGLSVSKYLGQLLSKGFKMEQKRVNGRHTWYIPLSLADVEKDVIEEVEA